MTDTRHITTTAPRAPQLTDREFASIRKLVYDSFGINLTEQKRSLVVGRLQKVLRQRGLSCFGEYLDYLRKDRSGEALEELANRISTNHTFFYREHQHFDFFRNTVLPGVIRKARSERKNDIRVWCAGCSSGEEPYTLVMLMREILGAEYARWSAGLLATDLSITALNTAMAGTYAAERLDKMPPALRNKYFDRMDRENWRVKEALRKEITFRRHNLMNPTFPFKHPFDAVFCRNVMIYFDRPTREALIAKFFRHTAPGGYLFIGHSESLGRENCPYQYVMPAVYRKAV